MNDSFDQIFENKSKVMVVFAHPDDAELYAGGTIARLLSKGLAVCSVKMTTGDMGSRQEKITQTELKELREKEDRAAMKIFGIKDENNIYFDLGDGKIENNQETMGKLVFQIRQFKPEIIITHNPEDVIIRFDKDVNWVNHRDHRNTGLVAIDAAYPFSRDNLFYPEQLKEVTTHSCTEFLLVDFYSHPDLVGIEVTDYIDTRIKAHAAHSSQYSLQHARDSADFFTLQPDDKRFEKFRYVIAD